MFAFTADEESSSMCKKKTNHAVTVTGTRRDAMMTKVAMEFMNHKEKRASMNPLFNGQLMFHKAEKCGLTIIQRVQHLPPKFLNHTTVRDVEKGVPVATAEVATLCFFKSVTGEPTMESCSEQTCGGSRQNMSGDFLLVA